MLYLKNNLKRYIFTVSLIVADFIIIIGMFSLSFWIRFRSGFFDNNLTQPFAPYFKFSFVLAFIGIFLLFYEGIFEIKKTLERIELLFKLFRIVLLITIFGIVISFVLKGSFVVGGIADHSRAVFGIFFILATITLFINNFLFEKIIVVFREKGFGFKRVLIVGTGETEINFWESIKDKNYISFKVLGFVTQKNKDIPEKLKNKVVGNIDQLKDLISKYTIEEVVVTNPSLRKNEFLQVLRMCEEMEIGVNVIPVIYNMMSYRTSVASVLNFPLVFMEKRILKKENIFIKRVMDIIFSFVFLFCLMPLFIVVAAAIKLESAGPVFYNQERLGKGKKSFFMYKFRSMVKGADKKLKEIEHLNEAEGPLFKIKNDPRITTVGKIIRKFSIDELPQLVNVLKGEMSMVGPRPSLKRESVKYKKGQLRRYDVKPGITGLPQVSGRSDLSFNKIIDMDILYMENWSIWLDLKILLKTIPVVLKSKGAY